MIFMLLDDMVTELGFEAVGQTTRLDEALQMVDTAEIDATILDVKLNN